MRIFALLFLSGFLHAGLTNIPGGGAASSGGGSSGGASTLAVSTGTPSGFSNWISSPTAVVNFSSSSFVGSLYGGATAYIELAPSRLIDLRGVSIDGGGFAIEKSTYGYVSVPYDAYISSWTIFGDQSGTITVNVKKATFAAFPTMSSICASACPSLSSSQKNNDYTLTGWTRDVVAGDILQFNTDAAATSVTRVNINLILRRK